MSLNGYSWVEGNVPNATDPTGMCTGLIGPCATALATGFIPLVDESFACGALAACAVLSGTLATVIMQVAQEVAEETGKALQEALDIVERAFNSYENPDEDPEDEPGPLFDPAPFMPGDPWPDPNPNKPCPDDEDCLEGRTPREQALIYAIFARQLFRLVSLGYDAQQSAPIVVAATRTKDPTTNQCVDVVGVNSHTAAKLDTPRLVRWNSARQMLKTLVYPPNILVGADNIVPEPYIAGVQGHAETNLNTRVQQMGQATEFMGVSKKPCPVFTEGGMQDIGCETWLRGLPNRPTVVYSEVWQLKRRVKVIRGLFSYTQC